MDNKKLSIVNLLVWGGAGLLLVGIVLGYLSLAPHIGALFHAPDIAQVVTVVVTPTPEVAVPLLPFVEEAPVRSTATPEATLALETETTSFPTVTYVPYIHPEDVNPVVTYTLPNEGAVPVRIYIPDIDLEAPIVPIGWKYIEIDGVTQPIWNVPNQRAAGWHETSAKIGVPGNTVLNGHNTSYGEVFRNLYKLKVGATILIEADDTMTYTYTVTEKLILPEGGQPIEVRIKNAQYALPTADERLTLLTCHPYGSLANRLAVIAHPAAQPITSSAGIEGD
ncbi:MAG: sortase [Anaerolineae bacterium]|nr:sortase [Anaerolineae bacterium]